jgi:hypothetical protein
MTVDIDKLKALALAATDEKWKMIDSGGSYGLRINMGYLGFFNKIRPNEYCEAETRAAVEFIEEACPATVLELIAEVEKVRARFGYIEGNATTRYAGHGFTVSFFVPVDCEDIGCGIDAAIAAHTKAGKEPTAAHTNDEFSKVKE